MAGVAPPEKLGVPDDALTLTLAVTLALALALTLTLTLALTPGARRRDPPAERPRFYWRAARASSAHDVRGRGQDAPRGPLKISPTSPLYLPYISLVSHLVVRLLQRLELSPISPLYLP